MTNTNPSGISINKSDRIVIISWQDGHESRYSFDGLRVVCPCVECKGGHQYMGGPVDPRTIRDAEAGDIFLRDAINVGSYAIQFYWSDGHSSGIYSWSLLRAACPCSICLPEVD
jgi:DUF971 family protein